jgi:hypothetical protein
MQISESYSNKTNAVFLSFLAIKIKHLVSTTYISATRIAEASGLFACKMLITSKVNATAPPMQKL